MNPLLKISSGVVATSGVSSTVVYRLTNPYEEDGEQENQKDKKEQEAISFRKRLEEIDRTPASSDEDGSKIQELYDQDYWNEPIPGLSKTDVKNDINLVIKGCEKKLKKDWVPWDMDLVESGCAVPTTIMDRLPHFGLQELDTGNHSWNRDDKTWNAKVKDYPFSDSTLRIRKTVGPDFEWRVVGDDLETAKRGELKKWCRGARLQPFQHEKFPIFEKFKHGCTKSMPPKPIEKDEPVSEQSEIEEGKENNLSANA